MLVVVATALVLVLAGCGGTGFQYVSSPSDGAFYKLPNKWRVFDEEQALMPTGESENGRTGLRFLSIFDASPTPDVQRQLRIISTMENDQAFQLVEDDIADGLPYNWPWFRLQTAEHPFGVAWVRELTLEERDAFSRFDLRNEVVPLDRINDQAIGEVRFLRPPEGIVKPRGLAGTRLAYEIQYAAPTPGSFTVDQTGLIDPDHRVVYFFIIGCQTECYNTNRSTITQIADSWTIKEP